MNLGKFFSSLYPCYSKSFKLNCQGKSKLYKNRLVKNILLIVPIPIKFPFLLYTNFSWFNLRRSFINTFHLPTVEKIIKGISKMEANKLNLNSKTLKIKIYIYRPWFQNLRIWGYQALFPKSDCSFKINQYNQIG